MEIASVTILEEEEQEKSEKKWKKKMRRKLGKKFRQMNVVKRALSTLRTIPDSLFQSMSARKSSPMGAGILSGEGV